MKAAAVCFSLLAVLLAGCSGDYSPTESARMAAWAPAESPSAIAVSEPAPAKAADKGNEVPANLLQRKLVYTAQMHLVVDDFEPVPAKVLGLLPPLDAVVAHSSFAGSPGSPRCGEWTIRVPVARYQELLTVLRSLGELRGLQADARDVTEEYYDVEARIRNKKGEEARLLKLLDDRTANLKDVLEVERELSRVREEVERMEGRMRVLQDLTTLSTVTLRVEEVKGFVPEQSPTFGTQARRTLAGSLTAVKLAAQGLALTAIALCPWAVVLVVVGGPVWGWYRWRRRRPAPGHPFASTPTPPPQT